MTRKNWSNLFVLLAALNLILAVLPANPVKALDWLALPFCLFMSIRARRRMI